MFKRLTSILLITCMVLEPMSVSPSYAFAAESVDVETDHYEDCLIGEAEDIFIDESNMNNADDEEAAFLENEYEGYIEAAIDNNDTYVLSDGTDIGSYIPYDGAPYKLLYRYLSDGTISITGYMLVDQTTNANVSAPLILPDTIDGCVVSTIADRAFYGYAKRLKFTGNLTIPDSVTYIGDNAFAFCSELTGNLVIPDSVTYLGKEAFNYCPGFSGTLYISSNITSIGDSTFDSCAGLKGNLVIPDGVTSIGEEAFGRCYGLTGTLNIPDSVTNIGRSAFISCRGFSGDLVIPSGIKCIEDCAFIGCSGMKGKLVIPNSVSSIGYAAFESCKFTGKLVIPESIVYIGEEAFYECKGFTGKLSIPDSVVSIGERAFAGCTGFTGDLVIPDSVSGIGEGAFTNCTGFSGKLVLPLSINKIRISTFEGCSGLTGSVIIPDGVESIQNKVFMGCSGLTGIVIPESVTQIAFNSFSNCNGLLRVINYSDSDFQLPLVTGEEWRNTNDWKIITVLNNGSAIRVNPNSEVVTSEYSSDIPDGKYRLRILDEKCFPVKGASITYQYHDYDPQVITTDDNGCADLDHKTSFGSPYIEVSKDGYMTWTNENLNWKFNTNRYEEVYIYPESAENRYRLKSAIFDGGLIGNLGRNPDPDLIHETKIMYLSNPSTVNTDQAFALKCRAWDSNSVCLYKLFQGNREIASSEDGCFELNTGMFAKGASCYVLVVPSDGSTAIRTPINLKFENKTDSVIEFSVGKDTKFKVGQEIPFFGGEELSFDFPALPVDLVVTDDKYHLGINIKGFKNYKSDDEFNKVVKTLESAAKTANTPVNRSSISDLVKENASGELPGFERSKIISGDWNVVGYLEGDLGAKQLKGMLYFELSAKAGNDWTFVVVTVPVVIDIEAKIGVKAGGEIGYNFASKTFTGHIFIDPKASLEIFGGVGVGKVAGVGVYGKGSIEFQINIVDSNNNTGLRKVDLTGEFGGKAYLGPFESKKVWAYQTWNLYTATDSVKPINNQTGTNSALSSVPLNRDETELFSTFDQPDDYYLSDLSYMSGESEWNGKQCEEIHTLGLGDLTYANVMMSSNESSFEPLLEDTFQNASPVVASDGENAWMAFLRADQDDGDIYVAISRYDGIRNEWSNPVRVNNKAVLDDKPVLMCAGNDLWLAYSEATSGITSIGYDLLDYARNRQIRLYKIDKDTLKPLESRTYSGDGFISGQNLSVVDGKPMLAYSDSELTDAESIFYSPNTKMMVVDLSTPGSKAVKFAESTVPVDQIIPGEYDGALCVGYVNREGDFYVGGVDFSTRVASDVYGRISYEYISGINDSVFVWNGTDSLCLSSGTSITAVGITDHYDIEEGELLYSANYEDDKYKTILRKVVISDNNADVISMEKILDEKYLENLNAFRIDGDSFIVAMNTSAEILDDDIKMSKDLVWARLGLVHDIQISGVEYDENGVKPGENIPVTVSIKNLGEEMVTGIDILVNDSLETTEVVSILSGDTADIIIDIAYPNDTTTYNISVAEMGITESSSRTDDNGTAFTLFSPDLSVDMNYQINNGRKGIVITTQNIGGGEEQGTLNLYDKDGNIYYSKETDILKAGDIEITSIWIPGSDQDRFIGSITAKLETTGSDLISFNNSAFLNADWHDEAEPEDSPILLEQAKAPKAVPEMGRVLAGTELISFVSETPGASIYYTIDGSTPTIESYLYTVPIEAAAVAVNNRISIKAIAYAEGYSQSDISVYAWSIGEPEEEPPVQQNYCVTFNPTGGSVNEDSRLIAYKGIYGATVSLPIPVRDGYVFIGWYTSNTDGIRVTDNSICKIAEDHTLYARWKPSRYNVCLISYDDVIADVITLSYNEKYGDLPTPNRIGYSFVGWYTEQTNGELVTADTIMEVSQDHTLYAYWNPIRYKVTFSKNSSSIGTDDNDVIGILPDIDAIFGDTFQLSGLLYSADGYSFIGWNTLADGTGTTYQPSAEVSNLSAEEDSTVTLYAQWRKLKAVAPAMNIACMTLEDEPLESGIRAYMSCATYGAVKYYVLNGNIEDYIDAESGVLDVSDPAVRRYTDPIVLSYENTETDGAGEHVKNINGDFTITVSAVAIKTGYEISDVSTYTFYLKDDSKDWGSLSPKAKEYLNVDDETTTFDVKIPENLWVCGIQDADYSGSAVTQPDMEVYFGKKLLKNGQDYSVKYSNNLKAGTATVTITGKGDISGTITRRFNVYPLDLSAVDEDSEPIIIAPDIKLVYNGRSQKGTTSVMYPVNGRYVTLKAGTDFTYAYPAQITGSASEDTDYVITLTGKGNYTGTASFTETILKKNTDQISVNKLKVLPIPAQTLAYGRYDDVSGTWIPNPASDRIMPCRPDITVKYADMVLTPYDSNTGEGDYSVKYSNNISSGTASVIITGHGRYYGSRTATYSIKNTPISKVSVQGLIEAFDYTGAPVEQTTYHETDNPDGYRLYYTAGLGAEPVYLVENRDYTVSYSNNINSGKNKASITFAGVGIYSGTLKKTYSIQAVDLNEAVSSGKLTVTVPLSIPYTKGSTAPEPVLMYKGRRLSSGSDYTLKYSNNQAVANADSNKPPTVTITGCRNFKGSLVRTFSISAADLNNGRISMSASDVKYTDKTGNCKTTVVLRDANGTKLIAGRDYDQNLTYTYEYDTCIIRKNDRNTYEQIVVSSGTEVDLVTDIVPNGAVIRVTADGKGNYAGDVSSISTTFRIVSADISKATVSTVTSYYFTGRHIELSAENDMIVKYSRNVLEAGEDFEIVPGSYVNNINKGTAKFTIRGLGDYGGTKEVSFKILSKPLSFKITYDKNNPAALGTVKTGTVAEGGKLAANSYKMTGYAFAGWSNKNGGEAAGGELYSSKGIFAPTHEMINEAGGYGGSITLYAQWTPVNYKITYKLNGGTTPKAPDTGIELNPGAYTIEPLPDSEGVSAILKAPTRLGYTFEGWYYDSRCSSKPLSPATDAGGNIIRDANGSIEACLVPAGSVGNITVYAKWIRE